MITNTPRVSPCAAQWRASSCVPSRAVIVSVVEPAGGDGSGRSGRFGVCAHAALRYIHSLGIERIRAHAKPLTERLQKELPAIGYPSITPAGNPTPIVSFLTPDYAGTAAKLRKAFGEPPIALRRWEVTDRSGEVSVVEGMRISPSVYCPW